MKRIFFASMTFVIASFIMACGDQGAGNKMNKPANNTNAAPAANAAAVEADIKKMAAEVYTALAKNDADALDKFYSDNYMLVDLDGSVKTKAERLAELRSGEVKFESITADEMNVRVNTEGTGAVSIVRATSKATNKGVATEGQVRVTSVWSKTKDGWKTVSAQATRITAAAPAKAEDASKTANAGKPAAPANK